MIGLLGGLSGDSYGVSCWLVGCLLEGVWATCTADACLRYPFGFLSGAICIRRAIRARRNDKMIDHWYLYYARIPRTIITRVYQAHESPVKTINQSARRLSLGPFKGVAGKASMIGSHVKIGFSIALQIKTLRQKKLYCSFQRRC